MPIFIVLLVALLSVPAFAAPRQPYGKWMDETLDLIEAKYHLPDSKLYRAKPNGPTDFAWGAGVQLSALTGAAKVDKKRIPAMNAFIEAMEAYWHADDKGIAGYDASANNKNFDRYYDDNVWIVLGLVEAYEITKNKAYLKRAREAMDFVEVGADDQLGGGIWWREVERKSKHACSTGPAIVAILRLHEYAPQDDDVKKARAWYAWMNEKLQDPKDGLYYDNLQVDGDIGRHKWSYNTALMIRANLLLADVNRKTDKAAAAKFTAEAVRLAESSRKHWFDEKTGAIKDGGRFAHLLVDSLVDLSDATGDQQWRKACEKAAAYARDNTRRRDGTYGEHWHEAPSRGKPAELIANSSAARAFARLAWPIDRTPGR